VNVFGAYSRYYDLLYADKNYATEVEFISAIIRHNMPAAKTLLDLGCGTGIHAYSLAEKGYQVTGLDRSADMLAKARKRCEAPQANGSGPVDFRQGDVRDFKLDRRFDVVVALFHVISYLPGNSDLEAAFAAIRDHLKPGGLLIFDHWYGPAVLTDRPAPRIKTFENDDIKVIRIATPTLIVNDNLVDVRYDLTIVEKSSGRCSQVVENHKMRYLFWPEIESMLSRHGLYRIAFCEWLSDKTPDQSSWNTFVVAEARPEA
jgi:SAM-dependent methyltransferase